jgi:hypothetical protein
LDRLKAAAELGSLDSSGLRAWHWTMDISVFDKTGANPQKGSLEMWFSDGNLRSVESLGTKQITSLRIGDKLYRTAGDEKDFAAISLIEMQALRPVPNEVIQPSTTVKLMPEAVASIKLDCLDPTVTQPTSDAVPGTETVSFCFEQGTPKMVVMEEPGNFSVLRPRVGMFQGHQVPVELQTFSGAVMLVDAKTTKLSTEPADASLFQVGPGMGPVEEVTLPQGDLRGLILSRNAPVLPADAKEKHLGGMVALDATIGKDGHIGPLQPTPLSNPALVASTKDAVSHWLFRPYLINGIPVEVKTQFVVTYGGGPRPPGGPGGGAPDDQGGGRGRH